MSTGLRHLVSLTTPHPPMPWRQISGDGAAASVNALFGRWEGGTYEMLEVVNVSGYHEDLETIPDPYWVWTTDYGPQDLVSGLAAEAIEDLDLGEWTEENAAEALFTSGFHVEAEQATAIGSVPTGCSGAGYRTLAAAMQAHGIPREALWSPSEYDKPLMRGF